MLPHTSVHKRLSLLLSPQVLSVCLHAHINARHKPLAYFVNHISSAASDSFSDSLMAIKSQTCPPHRCESECREIRESWGGLKTNLIERLASKSQHELRQIREAYMGMYGEDIVAELHKGSRSGLSLNTAAALAMWMLDSNERDALIAGDALQQSDINYKALIEIFVGRKSSHVLLIKQAYQTRYGRQLGHDILSIESPHPFQRILMALDASHNAHHAEVSQHIAKCDARRLYQTGEGQGGAIDEAVVLEILSKRSIPQLKQTFFCYKHIYGHDYAKSLMYQNYGEMGEALRTVVECIYNPPKFYAKTLYTSIRSTADKGTLARVMVSRARIDMGEIEGVFKKKYGMELKDSVCESISAGDYRDFLVALATRAEKITT